MRVDQRFMLTLDEFSITDDKGNIFIQQISLNKKLEDILATWTHISVQACVENLDNIFHLKDHPRITNDTLIKTKQYQNDSTLAIGMNTSTLITESLRESTARIDCENQLHESTARIN
jgi:hypothetical protein